jgi:hypothetical protein
MTDRVPRGGQPPVTPHDDALAEFVGEVKALYDLSDDDELRLLETVGSFVNIVAVNALARRPRVPTATIASVTVLPQGVADGPELMRPEEVSVALGIPVSTLGGMRRAGKGPSWFKEGRAVLYRRAEVRGWLDRHVPVVSTAPSNGVARDSIGTLPQPDNVDPSEARHDA